MTMTSKFGVLLKHNIWFEIKAETPAHADKVMNMQYMFSVIVLDLELVFSTDEAKLF